MNITLKELTEFFVSAGAENVRHTSKTYLGHAIAVYRDLQSWNCSDELCRAGMYHSIYGTERFQQFALSIERREEVRQLIGDRAEQLAYWNCVMDREAFDRAVARRVPPHPFVNRLTGEQTELSTPNFDDLCKIHLCDWLEQVPRCQQWDYRRQSYLNMAERLGGSALESYQRVFAAEARA